MNPIVLSVLCGLLLGFCLPLTGYERTLIPPAETNSVLDPSEPRHYVYKPESGKETGYLLVFYPGTRAKPSDYQRLMETAASLGHHVIGLSYPNKESINLDICPGTPTDECFRLARLEIHIGEDQHGAVRVDPENSIEGRLEALLAYLGLTDPDGGWGPFRLRDGTPRWEKVIVAGQSQGGGHAGFTAKRHAVARCVMFSATDWWRGAPAAWIAQSGETPPERIFGFTHLLDEAVPPHLQSPTWVAYGMTEDGGERVVDAASPPYRRSQRLYFEAPIAFDGEPEDNYHNALSVDEALELNESGDPVVLPVWEYLFSIPSAEPEYDFSTLDALHEELESTFAYPFAVYFYEGNEPIYTHEAGITRADSLPMASASKWLSGYVILAVAEAGYFSLDDPMRRHVPAFDIPGKENITIRDGFAMTAGMVPQDSSQDTLQWNPRYNLQESVDAIAANVPVVNTPGEVIYYWGGGMQAAGLAAVNATGFADWETVARTFLFDPLGMENSAFSRFLPNPAVAGGVETTGEDYLKFLAMLAGNGSAMDGKPFLPTETLAPIFSADGRNKPIAKSPFPSQDPWYPHGREPYYSFGAWILGDNPVTGEIEEVTSPGANGTYPWIDRRRGLHGIFLTNVPAGSGVARDPALRTFHEIRSAYDAARPDRQRALSIGGRTERLD